MKSKILLSTLFAIFSFAIIYSCSRKEDVPEIRSNKLPRSASANEINQDSLISNDTMLNAMLSLQEFMAKKFMAVDVDILENYINSGNLVAAYALIGMNSMHVDSVDSVYQAYIDYFFQNYDIGTTYLDSCGCGSPGSMGTSSENIARGLDFIRELQVYNPNLEDTSKNPFYKTNGPGNPPSGGGGGSGGPQPPPDYGCKWVNYISCLGLCSVALEVPILYYFCGYNCMCGFCWGKKMDSICK